MLFLCACGECAFCVGRCAFYVCGVCGGEEGGRRGDFFFCGVWVCVPFCREGTRPPQKKKTPHTQKNTPHTKKAHPTHKKTHHTKTSTPHTQNKQTHPKKAHTRHTHHIKNAPPLLSSLRSTTKKAHTLLFPHKKHLLSSPTIGTHNFSHKKRPLLLSHK